MKKTIRVKSVVFADTDRAFLWNVETGKLLLPGNTAIQGHSSSLTDVRFLPAQEHVTRRKVTVIAEAPQAAAGKKPDADAKPEEEKKEDGSKPVAADATKEMEVEVRSLVLRVVTTSLDGTAKIWDVSQNEAGQVPADLEQRKAFEGVRVKELLTLRGPVIGLSSVDVSADGRNIVSGAMDGTAVIWTAGQPAAEKEKEKVAGR